MYLTKASTLDIAKKQFLFKSRAFLNSLLSLITVQVIALLFSFNGNSSYWFGGSSVSVGINTYSANIILIFTIFWAFIVAITLTTKPYRYIDYSFITNRLTSHLSTLGVLVVYSVIGSLTATLMGIALRVTMYFSLDHIIGENYFIPFSDLILGFYIGTLYVLFFAIIGYVIGMLVQLSKIFAILIPAGLIGWFILGGAMLPTFKFVIFYFFEDSIFIFSVKILVTILLLICFIIPVTNRLEVR